MIGIYGNKNEKNHIQDCVATLKSNLLSGELRLILILSRFYRDIYNHGRLSSVIFGAKYSKYILNYSINYLPSSF